MQLALEALVDPTRRRIVELLADGELTAGQIADAFAISRPGVSRHLRVLREAGLVSAEANAQQRIYALTPEPMAELDEWLQRYRRFWTQRLDALETEVRRERRARIEHTNPDGG